jgi:CheY-like chemotaxis protein
MSKNIIWIEDDYDIIEPVIYPLRKAGYTVVNISNTKEASDKIEELKQADLILLDMFLPKGNGGEDFGLYPGYKLLQQLRTINKVKTPVIVFTVITNEELCKDLEELGINDIVYKPIRPSKLKEAIDKVFQKLTLS